MMMIVCDQCVDGAHCNPIFCWQPSTACGELWMGAQTYSLTLSQGRLYGCTTSDLAGELHEPDSRRQRIPLAGNRFLAKHDRFSSRCTTQRRWRPAPRMVLASRSTRMRMPATHDGDCRCASFTRLVFIAPPAALECRGFRRGSDRTQPPG